MLAISKASPHGVYILFIISALIAIGPFSMEAYLPALPAIAKEFKASIVQANFSISTYLLGLGLGQFLGGPISDQIGRRKNVVVGLSLFVIASIGIMYADSIEQVQLLRFLQALGGGFAAVVGMPAVRDIYEPKEAAKKMPLVSSVMFIAPIVAPMFGTVLMQWNWRVIFAFLALYSIAVLLLFGRYVGETRSPSSQISLLQILVQCKRVIKHRVESRHIGLRYILVATFSSGVFLTFLTNASWTYMSYFGLSEFAFPFYFAIHLLAFLVANVLVSRLVAYVDSFHILKIAIKVQAMCLGVLLTLAVWTDINIYIYISLLVFIVGAGVMINASVMAMLFAHFQRLTGSVVSLISLGRCSLGALLGVISGLLFDETLVPILGTMLFSSVCCFFVARSLPIETLHEVALRPKEEGL